MTASNEAFFMANGSEFAVPARRAGLRLGRGLGLMLALGCGAQVGEPEQLDALGQDWRQHPRDHGGDWRMAGYDASASPTW